MAKSYGPHAALLLVLACGPKQATPTGPTPDPAAPPGPWSPSASMTTAGDERCSVSRPTELGATLTVRGGPADVRIAANRHGALIAWMQAHPTKKLGRLVAVRAVDRQGRPTGVVQTMQPPVAGLLKEVVADDDGFYVLVQAPDQPRVNLAIAVRPDGSAIGGFVEVADTGGLAPVAHAPARGRSAAVIYDRPIGGGDARWVALSRGDDGVRVATTPVPQWGGVLAADDARAWVRGDGPHALLQAPDSAPLDLLVDGVPGSAAALPAIPLGLDAQWRGRDVDLVWATPGQDGPVVRRAILHADGALDIDPPALPPFEHALTLEWSSPPLQGARRTAAGRPLVGDRIDLRGADPAAIDDLAGTAWAWTGALFVIGYVADTPGGATTRALRLACP